MRARRGPFKLPGMFSRFVFVFAVLAAAAGCTHVASYERGKLAHPTMADDSLFASPASEHVYAVHEGAFGGGSVGSAGCGCN